MGLFGGRKAAPPTAPTPQSPRQLVEAVIAELGLSPDENRLASEDEGLAWALMKGSAEVFIFINPPEDGALAGSIQVLAPVMKLPEAPESTGALLRRLLQLNVEALSGASFGLRGDTVLIICDRSTEDLNLSEVREMILRVGHFADVYDDELVMQYGGRRHSE